MFEKASRLKLRFTTPRGQLSAEDLWDLPLSVLDGVAIGLHRATQQTNVSFVNPDSEPDPVVKLQFDIVKHVIDVRLAEKRQADDARVKAERKQKILGILARKEDAALESASDEELRGLLASL